MLAKKGGDLVQKKERTEYVQFSGIGLGCGYEDACSFRQQNW